MDADRYAAYRLFCGTLAELQPEEMSAEPRAALEDIAEGLLLIRAGADGLAGLWLEAAGTLQMLVAHEDWEPDAANWLFRRLLACGPRASQQAAMLSKELDLAGAAQSAVTRSPAAR